MSKLKLENHILSLIWSRRFVPVLLICFGAVLLTYVISQYSQMYLEQRRLAERWEQEQQERAAQPRSPSVRTIADYGTVRLVIPKIDLTTFVVEGTTHRALLLGPGHLENTPEPGGAGNSVVSGHRDTFFRHIHELQKGDTIYVDRDGKRIVYEVTGKKIVDPNDLSVTNPTTDSRLTLITCYPTYYIGPAPKRLVVFTRLSGEKQAQLIPAEQETTRSPAAVAVGH